MQHSTNIQQLNRTSQAQPHPMATDEAIVLMGHGSRDVEGAREFLTFAERLSARLARPIYSGFLELADPPIVSAIDEAIQAGAKSIIAVPWLLLGAGHVKNDLPTALQWAQKRHPQVPIRYGSPINVQPEILALLADRLAAIDPDQGQGAPATAVLLVQRGSSDPDANADVYRMARLLWEGRNYGTVEVAFSGVARPSIEEGLQRCLKYNVQHVLIIPYYLYTGVLVERISTKVAEVAARYPACEFRVASHLGQDSRLDRLAQRMIGEISRGKAAMTCDMCQYRVPLFGKEFLVRAPQVSDHSHGLRGTTMGEEMTHTEHIQNDPHQHAHSHDSDSHDPHQHAHSHPHDHTSALNERWKELCACVTAGGIVSMPEITSALVIWQEKRRSQLDTPPAYLLTAMPEHPATAALRWDWDMRQAQKFATWCCEVLNDRFGVQVRIDCEDEDPQLGPHYLCITSGERQERCDWRYLNQNHWMGAFCTIIDRLLEPVGLTALNLETGWFDTVVAFCRRNQSEEVLRWFPEAE